MKTVLSTIVAIIILSISINCFAEETELVKIFTSTSSGDADRASMEVQKKVNEWLKESKDKVITQRFASIAGGGSGSGKFVVSIAIFYKK